MKSIFLDQKTPEEILKSISSRLVALRKSANMTQLQLSKKSNVSYGSIKRFERTGEISLISLTKIAIALNVENQLDDLFKVKHYQSIEEIINGQD